MKRYLLFAYDDYYPSGGWNDFKGSFDSVEEAKSNIGSYECGEIVDSQTEKEVTYYYSPPFSHTGGTWKE